MKKSTFWILTTAAAAAALALGAWRLNKPQRTTNAPAAVVATPSIELASTDVFILQSQILTLGIPVSGSLKASQSAYIKARVAGELMALKLREGDSVQAGQVVAQVDPTEYLARVRQAQQQANAAQAQVDIAKRQLENNQALVNQGFISQTALITSQANLNGAQANHMATLAALDLAQKALSDATLRSPISGVLAQRLVQSGERVAIEARIAEVVNLSQLELEAALSPADASQVRVGMRAQLKVEGLPQTLNATVLRINPSAQTGSRNVVVYLGLSGGEGLRQGLFAQGRLGTQTLQALAVPISSVRTDQPEPYVQVVVNERVAHVKVQTGARSDSDGQTLVVVQGMNEGAQVLKGSVGAVREGVSVKFTAAAK